MPFPPTCLSVLRENPHMYKFNLILTVANQCKQGLFARYECQPVLRMPLRLSLEPCRLLAVPPFSTAFYKCALLNSSPTVIGGCWVCTVAVAWQCGRSGQFDWQHRSTRLVCLVLTNTVDYLTSEPFMIRGQRTWSFLNAWLVVA